MAALSTQAVNRVLQRLIDRWGSDPTRPQINKTMARAMIVGLDGYFDANASAINQAIPANSDGRALRTEATLTPIWKARVLAEVALARFEETT